MREFLIRTYTDDEAETCKKCSLQEVVRCKDCKWWKKQKVGGSCELNIRLGTSHNWFCADGERKE